MPASLAFQHTDKVADCPVGVQAPVCPCLPAGTAPSRGPAQHTQAPPVCQGTAEARCSTPGMLSSNASGGPCGPLAGLHCIACMNFMLCIECRGVHAQFSPRPYVGHPYSPGGTGASAILTFAQCAMLTAQCAVLSCCRRAWANTAKL
jgi:hypothetical protein